MRHLLRVRDIEGGILVEREGSLNAILIDNTVIFTNPSEVMANYDNFHYEIAVKNKVVTDQAYNKVLTNSRVHVVIRATLENSKYLPHPIILYNGAGITIEGEFHVVDKAEIMEVFVPGRRGMGENFVRGDVKAVTRIYSRGKLIVYDVFKVKDDDYLNPNVMGNKCLVSFFQVEDSEHQVSRELIDHRGVFRRWSEITGLWF
ncbi:urease accessory protein UreD [Metallosphaera tengchongensis]|uniref:Urease accessory protein UreD n=1 Tax=Metallosphaera tengchongensis TaxID=1532350 RepID=A0A6N0NYP7_9CREN|nr:urease accessory protein UreD [Metallosphaera tengchongensis]QKR00689.1 urease accessory protein UreD [Metallosphaera tengchongensis]